MPDDTTEVERLRKSVADLTDALGGWRELVEEIDDENSRLRDLVRKVEHYERLGCHECPYADGCEAHTLYDEECPMSREIERMKRELGFEVVDE